MRLQSLLTSAGLSACLVILLSTAAFAQSTAAWPVANERITLNFGPDRREQRVVLEKDGIALEFDRPVLMVGRDRIAIAANLPEAGKLQITLARPTDIKLVRTEDAADSAEYELVSQFKILGKADVAELIRAEIDELLKPGIERGRQEAHKRSKRAVEEYLDEHNSDPAFVLPKDPSELENKFSRLWAEENATGPVHDELQRLLDKHSTWGSQKDKIRDLARKGRPLLARFRELRELDLIQEHLTVCGFPPNADDRGAPKRLIPRFDAIYLIMSGKAALKTRGDKSPSEVLSVAQLKKLRQMLTADLKCRFTFAADEVSENPKWYDAQRVASRAAGPISRVQGRLTPADNNRIDWWRLDHWDPAQTALDLPPLTAARIEQYRSEGALLLRVITTQQEAVDYTFDVRPLGKVSADTVITIYKTPNSGELRFPY